MREAVSVLEARLRQGMKQGSLSLGVRHGEANLAEAGRTPYSNRSAHSHGPFIFGSCGLYFGYVLFENGRGGKRGKKQAVQSINSNCRRWLEGQRRELWEQGLRARSGTNQGHNKRKRDAADAALEKALFDRVKALTAQGQFSKACVTLMGSALVRPSVEVLQEMRDKHPSGDCSPPPGGLRSIPASAAPEADAEAVLNALSSFPRYSAGGPCCLRPNHLREAMCPGIRDQLLDNLVSMVNILLRGQALESMRDHFVGASLVALPKGDETHRPGQLLWERRLGD